VQLGDVIASRHVDHQRGALGDGEIVRPEGGAVGTGAKAEASDDVGRQHRAQ
jgi:hypothetical protein